MKEEGKQEYVFPLLLFQYRDVRILIRNNQRQIINHLDKNFIQRERQSQTPCI